MLVLGVCGVDAGCWSWGSVGMMLVLVVCEVEVGSGSLWG